MLCVFCALFDKLWTYSPQKWRVVISDILLTCLFGTTYDNSPVKPLSFFFWREDISSFKLLLDIRTTDSLVKLCKEPVELINSWEQITLGSDTNDNTSAKTNVMKNKASFNIFFIQIL